jgi:hypothetical protein
MICKARPSGGINQPTSNKGEAIIFRKMVIKKMRAEKRHEVTKEDYSTEHQGNAVDGLRLRYHR